MNGLPAAKEQQHSASPSSHLGKRKRSTSPRALLTNGTANTHQPKENIDNIICEVKKYVWSTCKAETY